MRSLYRPAVAALLGVAALLLALLPFSQAITGAFASGLSGSSGNAHVTSVAGKTIDWSHPIRVQPTKKRSGLSSEIAPDVVPEPVAETSGQVKPNANFPSNCYQNYGYYMGYQGQYIWTSTHGSVESWVAYFWCPRWSGDGIGINWSYGRDYALSGCKTMLIGNHNSGWYGADILRDTYPYEINDGEANASYTVCNGNYAWDDSLTQPGDGTYSVVMILKDTSGDQFYAESPNF
jgi:hypothetical protein